MTARRVHQRHLFDVRDYGATGAGTADDSVAVIAAIAACSAAGGGTVYFPVGTYRIDSQIVIPSDAGSGFGIVQVPITLKGDGARVDGLYGRTADMVGGTVLDLRYVGTGGKIQSLGWGTLTIEDLHMTQAAAADDATLFLYATLTVTRINRVTVSGHSTLTGVNCIQDAFQFGGTDVSFQGYTSEVRNVVFDRIRSGLVIRRSANAFFAENCGWTTNCGSNNTQGAIDIDSSGGSDIGGRYVHMTTEGDYPYRIRIKNAYNNVFDSPGFWDSDAGLLACVKLEGSSSSNAFLNVWPGGVEVARHVVKETSTDNYVWTEGTASRGLLAVNGGWETGGVGLAALSVQPSGVPADGADHRMLTVRRSLAESVDPNIEVAKVMYDGSAIFKDVTCGSNALGSGGVVSGSGNLNLYAGTAATDVVFINRGYLRLSSHATAGRPAASIGAGTVYYDTTIKKPVYSDGSKWYDAAGTEVADA